MEWDQKTPNAENLRQLPYSELKKIARKHGIKGNMKAEKIIATLLSTNFNDMGSFFTPTQKELNSSRKNKEERFNEDMMTPLVTPRRGTYSIDSPIVSNVTVARGSERKLRPRKVSFMSPVLTPRTPKNSSLKLRPKTPVALHTPLGKKVSPARLSRESVRKSGRKSSQISQVENCIPKDDKNKGKYNVDTSVQLPQIAEVIPSVKSTESDDSKSTSTRSLTVEDVASVKLKRIATPNFKKIHEKAFEKMESIDDYQKRKMNSVKKIRDKQSNVTKAKSRIPAFSGIPFVPSVSGSARTKFNRDLKLTKHAKDTQKNNENASQKYKSKFDLKASLSRKLGYKPYSGPLKPLAESSVLNTSSAACFHNVKEPVNKVVNVKRSQNRVILKGVRTNKRFELQMKNRKLE